MKLAWPGRKEKSAGQTEKTGIGVRLNVFSTQVEPRTNHFATGLIYLFSDGYANSIWRVKSSVESTTGKMKTERWFFSGYCRQNRQIKSEKSAADAERLKPLNGSIDSYSVNLSATNDDVNL